MKYILLFSIILFSFSNCAKNQTPIKTYGKISVKGNQILDQKGKPLSIAGPSFFWSNTDYGAERFYNAEAVQWAKKFQQATIVRAALGVEPHGGYIFDPENKKRITTVVDAAIAEGLYVIIDWHSHHAEDYEKEAIDFFTEMAETYGAFDNVIYEIYNEPLDVSWKDVLKPYSESVCAAIRKIDPDNLILIGTPNWSQDVEVASLDPITKFNNIAYTFHFYAGTHHQDLRDKALTALNNGLPIFVSEWGTINANGDGDVATESINEWLAFMKKHNLSHCNWALNDKKEGASILKNGVPSNGGWTKENLTPSGLFVTAVIKNWNKK